MKTNFLSGPKGSANKPWWTQQALETRTGCVSLRKFICVKERMWASPQIDFWARLYFKIFWKSPSLLQTTSPTHTHPLTQILQMMWWWLCYATGHCLIRDLTSICKGSNIAGKTHLLLSRTAFFVHWSAISKALMNLNSRVVFIFLFCYTGTFAMHSCDPPY